MWLVLTEKYVDFKWVSVLNGATTPTATTKTTTTTTTQESATIDTLNVKLLKQITDSTGEKISYYLVTATGTATGPVSLGCFVKANMPNGGGYALNQGLGDISFQSSWTNVVFDKNSNAYVAKRTASDPAVTNWTFSVPIYKEVYSTSGYINVIVYSTDGNIETHKDYTIPGFP